MPSAVAEVTLRQRRVIETVTASYQSIPHSYLSLIVSAAEASASVELMRTRTDAMISVSDLLVYGVSRAVSRHPKMNAFYDEGGIHLYEKTNVGVAMNLANGDLLVPVVANADSLPIDQIAGKLRGLQVKALRSKLTLTDLVGGTVTVTSFVGSGVSQVWPIIVPHQSAIFALGDPVPMGNTQSYFLCIAFDHRVLNCSEAAECLRDVVEVMLREDARG